ncbi:secreted protein [Vibrio variabilis]|uniref:Secreted protein n=1 Tax=Vibrio variabilis TaxID=990271 RepID=A0ABQ0J480_9VIBR|nr:secreted protein [Vibrio variabilis]
MKSLPFNILVGQYSDPHHLGFCALTLTLDGQLAQQTKLTNICDASYLVKTDSGIYVVSEQYQQDGAALYFVSHQGAILQRIALEGDAPCHIAISKDLNLIAVAHYGTGNFELFRLTSNGMIEDRISIITNKGHGPHPDRQLAPHGHQVAFIPNCSVFMTVDLGIDMLTFYEQHNEELEELQRLELPPGSGPRHAVFSCDGRIGFVLCELDESLVVIRRNRDKRWEVIANLDGFPEYKCHGAAAAIKLSADQRYLYLTSRGESIISWFDVSEPTNPVYQGHVSSGGDFPRDLSLSSDGKWLITANQRSHSVGLFSLNHETGQPTLVSKIENIAAPACIVVD